MVTVSGSHHENDATANANDAGVSSGLTLIPYEPQMVRYINDSFMVLCRSPIPDVKLHWKSPKGEIIKEHKGRIHIESSSKTGKMNFSVSFLAAVSSSTNLIVCPFLYLCVYVGVCRGGGASNRCLLVLQTNKMPMAGVLMRI